MNDYLKIYSHPRSGTHFLEAFLAENFYKNQDLSSNGPIYFGHWSNKILLEAGEPYHKLFGSHFFPEDSKFTKKMIYIYRDGRAVIASIYNSRFYHKDWGDLSFSEFLRKEIDWYGGLGQQKSTKINIVEHWYKHAEAWVGLQNKHLLKVRFEDLKEHPEKVYLDICKKHYPKKYWRAKIFGLHDVNPISKKVGLAPNKATIHSWKNLFSESDLAFFYSQIPSRQFLYDQ